MIARVIPRILVFLLLLPQFVSGQGSAALTPAEKVLLETPTPDRAERWLAQLTEDPHVAGTPQEKKLAEFVLARFKEFGLEAEMTRYDVFLNHPKHVSLS